MPNDKYVKREDIFPAVVEIAKEIVFGNQDDDKVVDIINSIPAADVEPVRHGKWIKSPECPEEYDICSVCGLNDKHRTRADQEHPAFESLPPRCKWCGAKMDEVSDND